MPPQPRHARQRARPAAAANQAAKTAGITPAGAAVAAADVGSRAARDAARARIPTGDRQYQGVIVAEFLVAVLIVAVAPLARGKAAQDSTSGPSPYGPDDIKQLAGIGAVYFVLALLSSGKHGRLAAWFGGLVLVAIGLAETTSGGLPAIFGIFQPAAQSAGSSDAGLQQATQQFISESQGAAQAAVSLGQRAGQATAGVVSVPGSVPVGQGIQPVSFTQPGVITTSDTGQSVG